MTNQLTFNTRTLIRTKMLKDSCAMKRACNLLSALLNVKLFPISFRVELIFTEDGLRATIYGSQLFDPAEIETALFGKHSEDDADTLFS